jgi:hypothetical protein
MAFNDDGLCYNKRPVFFYFKGVDFMRNGSVQCKIFLMVIWLALASVPLFSAVSSFRFIASAGALTDQDPYQPFFASRVFKGESNPPFIISNANVDVYEGDGVIFYTPDQASPGFFTAAKSVLITFMGFSGHSYNGILVAGNHNEEVRRYLGADTATYQGEKRVVNGKTMFAIVKQPTAKRIVWPKDGEKLKRIPSVMLKDTRNAQYLVTAREVGALSARLSLIDKLRAQGGKSVLLELGTQRGEAKNISQQAVAALTKRGPAAVFLGPVEMSSLLMHPGSLATLPVVYPFGDKSMRSVDIPPAKIRFWSITHGENVWPLFKELGKVMTLADAISLMKQESVDPHRPLNIAVVFSEEGAREAAKRVYVDLVILVDANPFAQWPSEETFNLRQAKSDSFEQSAVVVRVSYFDVVEINLIGPALHKIQQVKINRHFVSDGAVSDVVKHDAANHPALPSLSELYSKNDRTWNRDDLQKVLGGIVLNETKADVAILEALPDTTPIAGAVSLDLAKSLLNPGGNVITVTISGKQVKQVVKLINSDVLSRKFSVYGMDEKANLIGERPIADMERFSVALSEHALLDIFRISRVGGLMEHFSLRAEFVERIYGDYKQLFFIGGPKLVLISDTDKELESALSKVKVGTTFNDVITHSLVAEKTRTIKSFIDLPQGQPRQVLTLSIDYLDIGFSKNVTNQNYQNSSATFPISRGRIPIWAHFLGYFRGSINWDAPLTPDVYDGPWLRTSFTNETKYMHTDLNLKPEKDKIKSGLNFKLSVARAFFKEKPVVVAPILKNIYETSFSPSFWYAPPDAKQRTKRLDSLLGVNIDFTKLGFNMDVGGTMAVDFNRMNARNAIDFGPAINFFGRWSIYGPLELSSELTAYYLSSLPGNTEQNKIALGVEGAVFLRLARFYDFSMAAVSDFLIATVQSAPRAMVFSSIFGLTISYGRLFRLFG